MFSAAALAGLAAVLSWVLVSYAETRPLSRDAKGLLPEVAPVE